MGQRPPDGALGLTVSSTHWGAPSGPVSYETQVAHKCESVLNGLLRTLSHLPNLAGP